MNILLIEDDKYIARAYTDGLTRAGYRIHNAYDGAEALAKLRTTRPDLILLDLIMPVLDGFEVLKKIKADDRLKSIPILVLSNLGHEKHVKQALDLGANDYLVKSNHSMADIVKKIREYLPAKGEGQPSGRAGHPQAKKDG